MIQWSRRWLMIRQSPPLPQTSLSHFLFGSLFCVCPARAGQFLFVFLQERVTFTMEGFIWRGFLNHSADASPHHPSQPEEVNSQTYKKCQKVFQIWSQASMWFPPPLCGFFQIKNKKKHLSSHHCWADTKSIHPTKILQHLHLIMLPKRGSLPCIGQKTSWYISFYFILFYFVGNKRFIMIREVSKVQFKKKRQLSICQLERSTALSTMVLKSNCIITAAKNGQLVLWFLLAPGLEFPFLVLN